MLTLMRLLMLLALLGACHLPLVLSLPPVAATSSIHDRRFEPVALDEVPLLHCSVSLLTNFEEAASPYDWDVGSTPVLAAATTSNHAAASTDGRARHHCELQSGHAPLLGHVPPPGGQGSGCVTSRDALRGMATPDALPPQAGTSARRSSRWCARQGTAAASRTP